jgi:hypothetical protein
LTEAIVRLATRYGRYGYRRIRRLLVDEGWQVSVKRVYRIWRREGLKVPKKQPKRGRLWLNDGSCIRLRPERPNHVWSYDFVQDRTEDGRRFRMGSTSSRAAAWRSWWHASSSPTTCFTALPICSLRTDYRSMFGLTTGPNSSPGTCGSGSAGSA